MGIYDFLGKKEQVKINYCIEIIEDVKNKLENEALCYIDEALELCYQWKNNHIDIADDLYSYLDDEYHGFTIFQEAEENEYLINVWNCIIDAFAYICRAVYDDFGAKYYPEPIELVDEETFSRLKNYIESKNR